MLVRAVLAIFAASATAIAAPPTITSVSPRGLERGKTVTLTITGTNLAPPARLQLPFPAKQELIEDPKAKPNPAQVKLAVTVDPATPVGIYPVRLVNGEGLSGLTFLAVDSFPSIVESEDNNTPDKAQPVPVPVVVTGSCGGGDVDHYRFAARKGQRLVIATETSVIGSAVIPQIRLTDDKLRFIAADDSQSQRGECRLIVDIPADGNYVLEFSDSRYRGGNPPHYRIRIGEYDVYDELFPLGGRRGENPTFTLRGGTLAREVSFQRLLNDKRNAIDLSLDGIPIKPGMPAPRVVLGDYPERIWEKSEDRDPRRLDIVAPITVNSRLEHRNDVDRFQLPVVPGQKVRFSVEAFTLGSKLDGVLRITDAAGKQIALVDDVNVNAIAPGQQPFTNPDPSVDVAVPDGVTLLVAELRDQRRRGGINYTYRLTVEPMVDDFILQAASTEINVPRGGHAALNVSVARRGYAGPIELRAVDLPPGYTATGGLIPANGTSGLLTIAAAADVKPEPMEFRVEGTAGNLKRLARSLIVVGKDPAAPVIPISIDAVAVAPTAPPPITVQGPATLEVVKGYPIPIRVNVTRGKDAEKLAVEIAGAAASTPNVLTYTPVNVPADKNEGDLLITAPTAAPEGAFSFAVQGKVRVNNVDMVAVGPASRLQVVRPFVVEGPAAVTLVPGQTAPVRFTVARKGPFKEVININLAGLPAGVTLAEPLKPIPADRNEFTVQIKVDAKSAAANTALTLNASATVNGMAYTHPPLAIQAAFKK